LLNGLNEQTMPMLGFYRQAFPPSVKNKLFLATHPNAAAIYNEKIMLKICP